MKHYQGILFNQSIYLDTKEAKLIPLTELILLTSEPTYQIKKGLIKKEFKADEFRFSISSEALDNLILVLQAERENMKQKQLICDRNIVKMEEFKPKE